MNTIQNHQATLSLLNHLNASSGNSIFNEIISANQEQYEATLNKYGYGTQGNTSDSIFSKVEASSSNLLDAISNLRSENLYETKDGFEYDNSALIKAVSNFAQAYNTNLSNINASGKAISNTFLPEMDEAYEKGANLLSEIGIKRDSDGKLLLDTDKLGVANPEDIKSALCGSEYMSMLYKSTSSMNEIVSSALSYMSGYSNTGLGTDISGMMSSGFNSLG